MPTHGPRYRQRTTDAIDGNVTEYWLNTDFPSGIQRSVTDGVQYSAPFTSGIAGVTAAAVNNKRLTVAALGVHHSFIKDWVNSRDPDGDLPVAGVVHTKHQTIASNLVPWRTENGGGFVNQTATPVRATQPTIDFTAASYALQVPPLSQLQAFCDEAFDSFNTQFPTEVSIANFVWEMREIMGLLPKLSKSILKSLANAHLNIEFGWKPLISDIQAMMHALERVDARLASLRASYGHHTNLGMSRSNFHTNTLLAVGGTYTRNFGDGFGIDYKLVSYQTVFHAKGRLFHLMEYLDSAVGRVRALMGYFGFTNPALIVWEAIPYSFVVDWFTNLGDLIADIGELQDMGSQWKIDRLCWSVKINAQLEIAQFNVRGSGSRYWTEHRGSCYLQRYERYAGLSVTSSRLNLVSPTFKQQVLLAALLIGKS